MIRNRRLRRFHRFLSTAVTGLASVSGALLVSAPLALAPAHAGNLSFTTPNCARFTADGVGSDTVTINCLAQGQQAAVQAAAAPAPAMTCNASASTPVAQTATSIRVTATCAPASNGTSYTWTRLSGNASACPAAPAPGAVALITATEAAKNCSYSLTASDATYGQGTTVVTVSWSG